MSERTHFPEGHVVHMSLDHDGALQSVAECDCGWKNRVAWPGSLDKQVDAIEAHWRAVEAAAQVTP